MGWGRGLFSTWWGHRTHVPMPHCGPRDSPTGPAGVCGDRCGSHNLTDQRNDKRGANVQIIAVPLRQASQEGSCLGPGEGPLGCDP